MSQYVLLVYEEEVDPAVQAERERELPVFVERDMLSVMGA
jgi:hypothetical protein